MRVWIVAMTFAVGFSAVAVAQRPVDLTASQRAIEVVLDFKNRLALVPEGTILPAGLKFSGQWTTKRDAPWKRQRPLSSDQSRELAPAEKERVAFVFAYAPQSVFEPYRAAHPETRERTSATASPRKIKPLVFTCYGPFQVYASHPDCQSCSISLTHNFCTDDFSLAHPYTESYYADVYLGSNPAWAYSIISSEDNYFNCSQYSNYSSDPLSCYASDLRYNTDPVVGTVVHLEAAAEYWLWGDIFGVWVQASWSPYSLHSN